MEMMACGTNNTHSSTIKTIRISQIVEIYVTVEETSILVAYVMYKQKLQYRQELCYKSTINGCSLEIGGKEEIFENQNFMEFFFSHLTIILSTTNFISYLSFSIINNSTSKFLEKLKAADMDQIQKYPIVEVYITVENNRISATYMLYYKSDRKPVTLSYHNCSLGCQRVHDQMEELLENQDFMKLSIEDLSALLAMNNVLSFLSITIYGESCSLPNDDISIMFLSDLKEMLQTRDNSLVVNEITISFRSITIRQYIISIAKNCHPEIFQTLKVSVLAENENRSLNKTFHIDQLDDVENQFLAVKNELDIDYCDAETNLYTYTLTFSDEMSDDQALPICKSQNYPSIMGMFFNLTSYFTT